MALGSAYEDEAVQALVNTPTAPKPAPERGFSVWKTITAAPRGIVEAAAQGMASAAEIAGGFGQVAGAYPEALGVAGPNLSADQRRQADAQRRRLLTEGVDMSSEAGDLLREAGRSYRPDPVTSHAAEQVLYGFARGASKVVGGAVAMGPAGVLAAGAEEAMSAADDLRLQGVDLPTRATAGAVQGAGLALAALPIIGQTKLATAGLYAAGGPGGFIAQQAATREILQRAGYDQVAEQFDPFDPVGLAVATLLPAGFAAYGLRQQRLQRAAASLPDLPPRADAAPPADPAAPPAPMPSRPTAVADAVRAYPTEAVDAARVVLLAERRAAANPGAPDSLRAMDQHEAALSRAEDQIAAGEPVRVADVAPPVAPVAPRVAPTETPEFRAWFGDSKVVDSEGRPLVVYHGTGADIAAFDPTRSRDAGVWMTPVPGAAEMYSGAREGANLIPAYVSLRNPYEARVGESRTDALMRAVDGGHDGVIVREADGSISTLAAFRPEQIKSATGNSGRFDPNSGSLTDSPYATWAEQITAAIREMQAQARPTDAPAAAVQPAAAAADARPTVTNKAGEVYIDTRGTGLRLHGTGKPIAALSDEYALTGDSRNIYGQGFYTTDAADIAAGYMKKGGRNAALYEVRVSEGTRLYDMEQPMSPEVVQIARDNMGDNFPTENGETGAPLTSLREVYDEYRAESRNNGLSRDDVQEVFDGIRYRLEAQGYAGFQHIGGAATGNRAHTVQILWMPERDVTITPISLDQFKPDAPTTTQAANPEAAAPARGAGDPPAAGAADAGRPATGVEADGVTGPTGATAQAVTERGMAIPLRYRLAEAGDLTTSHTNDLTPNPAFPPELQPRDRARAASAEQISRIENAIRPELLGESVKASDGAPIVGPDAVVESGNARTIALRRAYDSGRADAYRAWLADNAERFGLTRADVEGMQRPVLVRERLGDVNRAEFARQANESAVAAMSPTEQARADAGRITDLTGLVANEDGTINATQSADFIRTFLQQAVAPTERGAMIQADGRLSAAGMQRLRNAVFAKAYGDPEILAMLTESTDANVRNILAGMMRAAPEVAKLRDLIEAGARQDADIAGPLAEAVRLFSQLRTEGRTVQQFLAQGSMFGDGPAPGVVSMLEALQADSRAPKRVAEMIGRMVDAVNAAGDARQMGMFGDAPQGGDLVAGAAERAVVDSRLAMAAEKFPDLQVQLDGMDSPMPLAEFMAAAKAEADELAADAPLMQVAAECALLNGLG